MAVRICQSCAALLGWERPASAFDERPGICDWFTC